MSATLRARAFRLEMRAWQAISSSRTDANRMRTLTFSAEPTRLREATYQAHLLGLGLVDHLASAAVRNSVRQIEQVLW